MRIKLADAHEKDQEEINPLSFELSGCVCVCIFACACVCVCAFWICDLCVHKCNREFTDASTVTKIMPAGKMKTLLDVPLK